jgi:PAS domain S-box-containing protein
LLQEDSHNSFGDGIKLIPSDDQYQALFDKSSIPMWILGLPNLNFLAVNNAAITHYGFSREEFLAMSIFDIRSRTEKEKLMELMHQPLFFTPLKQQWKHVKKNGEEISVEVTAHDILFNGIKSRVVSIYDITEQIEQEKKIKELNQLLVDNERRYRSVFGNAKHAIILAEYDQDWKIVETNHAATELFGYNYEEFKLLKRSDLLDLQQKDIVSAIEFRDKTGSVNGEFIGIKKGGQKFDCEINSVVFHDLSGKLWRSTMISAISLRVNAAINQIRDKALLNQAEVLASIGSVEINVLDGSRLWSDGFYRLLGYEPGAIKPDMTVFLEQLYPDDFNNYIAWYNQIINQAIPESNIEIRVRRKDGMIRVFSVNSRSELDKNGKVVKLFGVIQDITKNKQYETELELTKKEIQKDKALLESIINSPKDIFIVSFDNNYCITAFTNGYKEHLQKRFGINLRLGMNMLDASPPQLRELAKQQFDRALSGEYFIMSRPLEIQPGVWRHYENNYAPIIGVDGKIDGFTVFVHDVDEIKRIEKENRLNELRYSALFSGASDAIIIAEVANKQIVDLNEKATKLLGFGKEELIGKGINAIHPAAIMDEVKLIFQKFTNEGSHDYGEETFVLHKNGSWIPVAIFAGAVFNINDKAYSAAYFKDITKVKETEIRLKNISDLLNRAEGIAHIGSVEVDLVTKNRIWSDEFYRILGLAPNAMPPEKQLFTTMIHPEDRNRYEDWYQESISKKGMLQPIEIRIIRKDGQVRNLFISGMSYESDAGILVKHIGVIRDVTEQKSIQLNLEKQNSQLKEIAWTQSHVVRAPLARLIGLVKMFKKNLVSPEDEALMIDYILKSANELDLVIHEITNKTISVENIPGMGTENEMRI